MFRFLPAFLLGVALLSGTGHAQGTAAKPTPAQLNANQAKDALETIKDPKKRAELITALEAIAKTGVVPTVAPPAAAEPAGAIPLAPDSLGAQLLVGVPDRLAQLSDELTQTFDAATDFPLLWLWISQLTSDPAVQQRLYEVGWRLAVVMGVALLAEFLLRQALRRPIRALAARAPALPPVPEAEAVAGLAAAEAGEFEAADVPPGTAPSRPGWFRRLLRGLRKLPYVLAAEALDLLPLLAILGLSNGVLNIAIDASAVTTLVIQAVVNGYVTWRIVVGGVRLLLAPDAPRLRVLPTSDATAAHLLLWAQRIAAIGIAGGAVADVGVFFGLYHLAHDALVKLVWFAVVVCLITVVVHYRSGVARWLRGHTRRPDETIGLVIQARHRLAPVWHHIVIVGLLSVWLVSALEISGGYRWLAKAFLSTATILVLSQVLTRIAVASLRDFLRRSIDSAAPSAFEGRLLAYEPLGRSLVKAGCLVLTTIALAEAWGIPATSWFAQGRLGARMLGSLGSIALTMSIGLGIWETVNAAIARHQARLSASEQAARSARLRTLLPMLRTTLLITIVTIVALIVLSEIGVNIAPLLAGAGVIGLAIGFGSQKLVQDIITGLFLLLENAMQVGDVVTLGGLSGTVENLSIRTIRLRAVDGSVHIVPFSAVTSVTNMSRDFGYAVVDVSVGLNEDSDRITALLKDIAVEMRAEDAWRGAVLADLDVLGLEKFLPNAWVMRVRMRTTPGQRWAVGRELNRRIKQRFDELKIESPMTSYRALGIATPHPDALMATLSQTFGAS